MHTEPKTYLVSMQSRDRKWECKTQAVSKFDAMLAMNMKYGHECVAVDAKEIDDEQQASAVR